MQSLIAKDDITLNNGISLSLSNDTITQAYSLRKAREKLTAEIELIILDINLPDSNGLDFCREIKKQLGADHFLTANDLVIDIITGLESDADDYITKPFSLAVLQARINVMAHRQMTACSNAPTVEFTIKKNKIVPASTSDFSRRCFLLSLT